MRKLRLVENEQTEGPLYALKDVWVPRDPVLGDGIQSKAKTFAPTQLDAFDELGNTGQITRHPRDFVDSKGPIQPILRLSRTKRKLSEVLPPGITDGGGNPNVSRQLLGAGNSINSIPTNTPKSYLWVLGSLFTTYATIQTYGLPSKEALKMSMTY